MTNKCLLKNTIDDVYCRISPSKIHGVGVFAIRDIPKGINPFRLTNDKCMDYNSKIITQNDMKLISPEVRKMIQDYIVPNNNNEYELPYNGLNSLDISFYMNHSVNNNIDSYADKCDYYKFITNRKINKGEELLINYNHYDD